MTRFLRNDEGGFSAWAKTALGALVAAFVIFTLTASAKVTFGGPAEAKLQETKEKGISDHLASIDDRLHRIEESIESIRQERRHAAR